MRLGLAAVVALVTGACASGGGSGGGASQNATSTATPAKLTAALVPAGGNVRGSVDIDSGIEPNKSRARIELRGAAVGAQHGWQVRTGRCGETTQVVGSPAAYRPIPVRADGTADITVTIPIALDANRQYNAALFASRTDLEGVIACGNLTVR